MRTPIPTPGRLLALPALAVLAGLLVLAGCGSAAATNSTPPTATTAPTAAPTTAPTATAPSGGGGAQASVTIGGVGTYKFSPGTMSVKVGTTVTWTNNTQAPHTVTSDSGDPDSFNGSVDSGGTFSFTFTKPGTYNYHCSIHPYMTATITVTQ